MSFASDAKNILDIAASGLHGLEMVGDIASSLIPNADPKVLAGLHAIVAIVDSVRNGLDGTASVQDVQDRIADARAKMTSNDQSGQKAIDDAIDAKFPTG